MAQGVLGTPVAAGDPAGGLISVAPLDSVIPGLGPGIHAFAGRRDRHSGAMTANAPQRFYKEAAAVAVPGGWGIALDGKPVRTPAKNPLVLESRALADAIAAEWNAQEAKVKPDTTMRELHFPDAALRPAPAPATKDALPYLETLSLAPTIKELGFFKGKGCDACAGTGLKGRQGVYEVMLMTPTIRKLVMQNVGAADIRDAAVAEGMLTLRMDAWLKVMKGITTTEQMIRETSA